MSARTSDKTVVSLIAALDRGFAIGRDGAMPWHLPEDLKRFKRLTLGKPILMGSKTARAVGRALPGRRNLVLTRGDRAPFQDQEVVHTLDAAIDIASDGELCVIGGGEIYALALPRASRLHLTWVDTETRDADAFFPRFAESEWIETFREPHGGDAKHALGFTFVDYERRR
jgi:dihydrofolate reductase